MLGLTTDHRIKVSSAFSARTSAGRRVYELADAALAPRPGTPLAAPEHLDWHDLQVFKGTALTA